MTANFAAQMPGEIVDVEVFCVLMLTSAIIGPRVFKNSVQPASHIDTIVERFRLEQLRMLRHDALIK